MRSDDRTTAIRRQGIRSRETRLEYAGRTTRRRRSHDPPDSPGTGCARPSSAARRPRLRGAPRGPEGRAAELVAGALDRPGAAARAREEPRRCRGDEHRAGAHRRPGEGEPRRHVPLRGRRHRREGGARAPRPRHSHLRGNGHDPVRGPRPAPAPGPLPGLLAGRRDLPADARPLRERRPVERRPGGLEGAPRPDEGALLPRRRPARRDRAAALREGPRRRPRSG